MLRRLASHQRWPRPVPHRAPAGAGRAPGQTSAAIPIDADDIGGVVTGPNGPEAGVWVIAETPISRRSSSGSSSPTTRAVSPSGPAEGELPRLGARLRAGGFAEGAVARPGKLAEPDRRAGARRARGGAVLSRRATGSRCSSPPTRASSPAPARRATASRRPSKTRPSGCAASSPAAASACHQLGNKATREIPASARHVRVVASTAWERRIQSGQAGGSMIGGLNAARPPARAGDVRRLDRSHRRGRGAAGAAAAAGHRAQRRHHASGTGPIRRRTCTTRSRPTGATRPSTPTARSTARSS